MRSLTLLCLALLALAVSSDYCSSGSSFPTDIKKRHDSCGTLLAGGKHHDSSSSSDDSSSSSDSDSGSQEASSSGSGSGSSGSGSGSSGSGSGSSGSGSGSSSGSGSGSSESSSGSEEDSSSGSNEDGSSGSEESGSGSGSGSGSSGSGSGSGSGSSGSGSGSGSDSSGSGSSSSSGSGSGLLPYDDYCLLLQYFYNISIEIEVSYSVEVYEAFVLFIHECQYEVIYDESLTIEAKLVAIYSKLEVFLVNYSEVRELILYTYISEWEGYVFDLEATTLFIQYSYTQAIVTIEGGSCTLFEALLNGTSYDAELYAKVEVLIEEIRVILVSTSYSYSYQLVLVYEKIQAFFVEYSSYKEILLQIEIEGYGSFASFYEVIEVYWQISNFDLAVGSSGSDCALVQVLNQTVYNESISVSQRGQIKQLVEDIVSKFESTTVAETRVQVFVETFYQFVILQEWSVQLIFSLEIEGYGSIYELLVAYSFEFDCGCVDFSLPTTSTEAVTTAKAAGDCDLASQIVTFSQNNTDLSWSIDQAELSWSEEDVSRFAAYEKRIWIVSSNQTATRQEVIENVVNVLNKWSANETIRDLVYNVNIYAYHETATSYVWGSVKQFCGCA